MQAKKRAEAEENLKHADKYMAKTMFRWHPDYLSAAPYLEKAAECYRSAGELERAKAVFLKAAKVQQKNKSSFRAAQHTEQAAKLAVQLIKENRMLQGPDKKGKFVEVKKLVEAASNHYTDMGELGKAAEALVKGATQCEENGFDDVLDLYLNACSLLETQGKPHFAIDTFRKTLSFLVKRQLFAESLQLLERQVALFKAMDQVANVHKCYLSEIVLQLTLGDVAAADTAYMKHLQDDLYLKADECALEEDLVRAYKTSNEELLQTTIKKQGFGFLDNQIGRLARKLSLYGAGVSGADPAGAAMEYDIPQPPARPGTSSSASRARPAPASASTTSSSRAPPAPARVEVTPNAVPFQQDGNEYEEPTARTTSKPKPKPAAANDFDFDALQFANVSIHYDQESAKESDDETKPAPTSAPAPAPAALAPAPAPSAVEEDPGMMDLT